MFNSIVVDASYIHKMYSEQGLIGKGRDIIHGLQCTITLVTEKDGKGRYALQVFENLNPDIFNIKVTQLTKSMTENLTNYTQRIRLIAQRTINNKQYDLYVLYEFFDFKQNLFNTDRLDIDSAKQLLEIMCKNLLLGGRFTKEYLDIAPQNIYINTQNNPLYPKYVISNFGISYKGSKFHREYIPSSDPFVKKRLETPYIIQSYAFQAALVTLSCLTKVNSNDFFFNDQQFDSYLLRDYLKLLKEDNESSQKKDPKLVEEQQKKILKQLPSLAKIDKPFEIKYPRSFLKILSHLLQLDLSKRSIFSLLVSHPENYLKVKNPYFDKCPDNKQHYSGCGQLEEGKVVPQECGVNVEDKQIYYGCFQNGQPNGIGCREVRNKGQLTFIQENMENGDGSILLIMNKFVYMGEYDNTTYIPQGEGTAIAVQNFSRIRKETPVYFKGKFEKGRKNEGTEYYRDKNEFEGTFIDDYPAKGIMTYNDEHIFEGTFDAFKKKHGTLYLGELTFEGSFINNRAGIGKLVYKDGSEFDGTFYPNGDRNEGTFSYPESRFKYKGKYLNNQRSGKGLLIDDLTKEEVEVDYENGVRKKIQEDKLPEAFEKYLKQKDQKTKSIQKTVQKPQTTPGQGKKAQDDEEIQEDIQNDEDEDDKQDINENYDEDEA